MKRIIIPFANMPSSPSVLTFAITISKEHNVPVYGVFIEEPVKDMNFSYPFPNDLSSTADKVSPKDIVAENAQLMNDEMAHFENECDTKDIDGKIIINNSIKQFLDETLDTDLMITDAKAVFLENVLPQANCPAYLVSESERPKKVIVLYDGGDSGKYAVKMYTTYFPEWRNISTAVVCINAKENEQQEIESEIKRELFPLFSDSTIRFITGNKEKALVNFLEQYTNATLVVMGAYGRSAISRFFHESLANVILENTGCSLFIGHR